VDIKVGTLGIGLVGVAGSVGVASINSITNALINSGSRISTVNQNPAYATGAGCVGDANDTATMTNGIGSAAGGLVGVGVAVNVASITNQVNATIGASSLVRAQRDVDVRAVSNWNLRTFTVAFSGGLFAAINGAVSVVRVGGALDAGGADEANNMQAETNSQISMSSGAKNLNTNDATAQRAKTRTATSRFSINDNLQTAPATAGTTASVGNGATVTAGDDLRIVSESDLMVDVDVGGAAAGLVGFGGSAGIATMPTGTDAFAGSGALLSAVKDLQVLATGRSIPARSARLRARRDWSVWGPRFSVIDSDNDASAYLNGGSTVTSAADLRVQATTTSNLNATANGAAFGRGSGGLRLRDGQRAPARRRRIWPAAFTSAARRPVLPRSAT